MRAASLSLSKRPWSFSFASDDDHDDGVVVQIADSRVAGERSGPYSHGFDDQGRYPGNCGKKIRATMQVVDLPDGIGKRSKNDAASCNGCMHDPGRGMIPGWACEMSHSLGKTIAEQCERYDEWSAHFVL